MGTDGCLARRQVYRRVHKFSKKHKSDVKILGTTVQNSVVMATWSPAFVHSWQSTCVTNRPPVANFKPRVYDQIQASAISPPLPQAILLLSYSEDALLEFRQGRRLSWFFRGFTQHLPSTGHKLETDQRHASHNDVSDNDGPYIRRWSHNIIAL
jgi:hypothetical protein